MTVLNWLWDNLAGVALIAFGLLFLAGAVVTAYKAYGARSWPFVKGRIILAKVVSYWSKGSESWLMYKPDIQYEYKVDGNVHLGSKICLMLASWSVPAFAASVVSKYAKGKIVKVYYNPSNPDDAMLDTSIPVWGIALLLIISAVCIVIGILFLRKIIDAS